MPRKKMRPSAVMKTAEAAVYVGLAESTLEKMRLDPKLNGPPFLELGTAIRYRVVDLDEWLAKRVATAAQRRTRRKR